ncbi:hypothetical protein GCM10018952_15280 [Streptosporangium vulgare]
MPGKVVSLLAVEAAEEQGRAGVVGERLDALVQQRLQDLLGDPVSGGVGGEGAGVLAHRAERRPGDGEVLALGGEDPGGVVGYVGGQLMCGHAEVPPIRQTEVVVIGQRIDQLSGDHPASQKD